MSTLLLMYLSTLKSALQKDPSPALILAALYLVTEFESHEMPRWALNLANGKIYDWETTYATVMKELKIAEPMKV